VKGSYNYVLARAVAPLPRLIESTWHLIAPADHFLPSKGSRQPRDGYTNLKSLNPITHEINLDDLPTGRIIEAVKAG